MTRQNLPVVFLAFANDQGGGEGYLRQLRNEAEQLRDLLEQAGDVCEVVVRESASLKNILDVFQSPKYKHRIAIFHFGGHANSYQLLLESVKGKALPANAAGLTAFLSQQRGLHLVFLNGCATREQAHGLLDAGVQAVIATDRKIKDDVAVEFAARFYRGLTGGDDIPTAFAAAQGAVQTDIGDDVTRAYLDEEDFGDLPPEVWPWQLYPPELPPEIAGWNLGQLADNPYWVLPPLPPGRRLPDKPFLGLSYFREKHTHIFFGRGWQILELFKLITNDVSPVDEETIVNPIILLYGQSGVGKSSLLAAGLLPRLKQVAEVRYIRREDAGNNLTAALRQALGDAPSPNPSHREGDAAPPPDGGRLGGGQESHSLSNRWLSQETDDRPLVIILDQVEEIYTRPNGDPKEELAAFLDALQTIFDDDVDPWPRGKLILGFRKEWLAEIRDRLAERDLPYKEMFLKHLDRPGIIEAITGPKAHYDLVITDEGPNETQVPEIIADDLLADRGSAIAPTLQIILTKLWENATGKPKVFDRDLYDDLRLEKANYLSQLLDKQLALMKKDHPTESASGLVLDLLAYHTTEVGTTQQRSRAELAEAYSHQADTLPGVVQSCKDRYLLVDPSGAEDEETPDATRLSHDTLGPLVRARFVDSQKPGQKAYRLLQNRIPDWRNGGQGTPLDSVDLKIVEDGQAGMRTWDDDEERLVDASQTARKRRRQWRRVWQSTGAIALATIIILGVVAWLTSLEREKERNRSTARALLAEADLIFEHEPLFGLRLALEAWYQVPGNVEQLPDCNIEAQDKDTSLRCSILSNIQNKVTQGKVLKLGDDVQDVLYVDEKSSAFVVNRINKPSEFVQLTSNGIHSTTLDGEVYQVWPSPSRETVAVEYEGYPGKIYLFDGYNITPTLVTLIISKYTHFEEAEYAIDDKYILISDGSYVNDYNANKINNNDGKIWGLYETTPKGNASTLFGNHHVKHFLTGTFFLQSGYYRPTELYQLTQQGIISYALYDEFVDKVWYDPNGNSTVVEARRYDPNADIYRSYASFYDLTQDPILWISPLGDISRINQVWYSPDGKKIIVSSADDYSSIFLNLEQKNRYIQHLKGRVTQVIFDQDEIYALIEDWLPGRSWPYYGLFHYTTTTVDYTPFSQNIIRVWPSTTMTAVVDYHDGTSELYYQTIEGISSTLLRHNVNNVWYSPDNTSVVVSYHESGGDLFLLNSTSIYALPLSESPIRDVIFSPDSTSVIVTYFHKDAELYHLKPDVIPSAPFPHSVSSSYIKYSSNGTNVTIDDRFYNLFDSKHTPNLIQDNIDLTWSDQNGTLFLFDKKDRYELWQIRGYMQRLVTLSSDLAIPRINTGEMEEDGFISLDDRKFIAKYADNTAFVLDLDWLEITSNIVVSKIEGITVNKLFESICQPFDAGFFTEEDEDQLIEKLKLFEIREAQACE